MRITTFPSTYERMVIEDFEDIQNRSYGSLHDDFIARLSNGIEDFFIEDGFKVLFNNATSFDVTAGRGYQTDASPGAGEPTLKGLELSANLTGQSLTAADGSNDRIDVVSVSFNKVTDSTDTRDVKTGGTGPITPTVLVKGESYTYNITVTDGTPSATPSAPATPAGEVKIAEILVTAVTGVADQDAITDYREMFSAMNYKNLSVSDITYRHGETSTRFGLNILTGKTHTVEAGGTLVSGDLVVDGTLTVNGTSVVLY